MKRYTGKYAKVCPAEPRHGLMQKGRKFWRCPVCKCIFLRIKSEEEFEEIADEKK